LILIRENDSNLTNFSCYFGNLYASFVGFNGRASQSDQRLPFTPAEWAEACDLTLVQHRQFPAPFYLSDETGGSQVNTILK